MASSSRRRQLSSEEDNDTLSPLTRPVNIPRGSHNDTDIDEQMLPRRKVSFHSSADNSPSTRRDIEPRGVAVDTESDGDENTAILSKPKGWNRHYNTQGSPRGGSQRSSKRSSLKDVQPQSDADGHEDEGNGHRADDEDNGQQEESDDSKESSHSWWKSILEKYGSVELENKGSVARDHLALERTFLAWLRTSLSFASIGIAVTQLFRLNTTLQDSDPSSPQLRLRHVGKPLGATFLAIGIITLLIGFHRYFESQHYVIRGKFPASRGSVISVAFMTAALIVASFVVILTIAPKALARPG